MHLRPRAIALVTPLFLLVALPAGSAAAEEPPASTTTTTALDGSDSTDDSNPEDPGATTTTPSSSTTDSTTAGTSTSAPADGESGTTVATAPTSESTPVPATNPDGEIPDAVEGETTTTDPLIDEAPAEEAPETDETVPPEGSYRGQNGYKPAEVLWSSVRAARTKVASARAVHEQLVDNVRAIRLHHKSLRAEERLLDAESSVAADEYREAETTLRDRAVAAFMNDDVLNNAMVGSFDAADHDEVLALQARRTLLSAVLDQDDDAIAAYLELRRSLDGEVMATVDSIRITENALREAIVEAELAWDDVVQAEIELEAFAAGSAIYIDDVVFPVGPGYGVPLIDSYGFPRMPGTPDEHWHEGIDIFAPAGTPLVAAERSVVMRVGSGRLGGLTVWLRGESGAEWYYAHLQSHAPDLAPNMVIDAGHVIGYVGNTGNAISTPTHLHLQVHPGGGDPVNPYPLLKVVSDRDLARAVS